MAAERSRDLVLHQGRPPDRIVDEARDLVKDATAAEAKEMRDQAAAHEAYARAKNLRDAYQAAGEAKLWAERRLGELRAGVRKHRGWSRVPLVGASDPVEDRRGTTLNGFDERLGIPKWHARKYEQLAAIPENEFARILEEIRRNDGAYNASGVLGRDGKLYEEKVEPSIYRIRDGRLCLQWKQMGVKHREVLAHGDLPRARVRLAMVTGRVRDPHVAERHTVDTAYALVRRALHVISMLDSNEAGPESHETLNRATAALHMAEDEIVKAANAWGRTDIR